MIKDRQNKKKDPQLSQLLLGISTPFSDMLCISRISIERNKNEVDWVYIDGAIAFSILTDKTLKSLYLGFYEPDSSENLRDYSL